MPGSDLRFEHPTWGGQGVGVAESRKRKGPRLKQRHPCFRFTDPCDHEGARKALALRSGLRL